MNEDIKKLGVTYKLADCELTRIDIDDEHYYFIDGEYCVSVTRILDLAAPFPEGLRNWLRTTDEEESNQRFSLARDRGSKLHDVLDRLLNGLEVTKDELPTQYEKDATATFIRVMRFLQPTDIETELIVGDKEMKLGGTTDKVATADLRRLKLLLDPTTYLQVVDDDFVVKDKYAHLLEGEPQPIRYIWDHKFTGRSTYNHKVQVSKYRHMYIKSYPRREAPKVALTWRYSPKHKHRYQLGESTLPEKSFDRIFETGIEYLGGFPEPPKLIVYPEKFRLFEPIKQPVKEKA